jgi:hypothetical protein
MFQFIVIVADLYQNCLSFKSFQNILTSVVVTHTQYFALFVKKINFISHTVTLDLSCSFIVQGGWVLLMWCVYFVLFVSELCMVLELGDLYYLYISFWQCTSQLIVCVDLLCYFVVNYCFASDRISSSESHCFSLVDCISPYFDITFYNSYTDFCNKLSKYAIITWPPATWGARGGAVGWGTKLQTGTSRVRFPMMSLEFFTDLIVSVALWPWGRLTL